MARNRLSAILQAAVGLLLIATVPLSCSNDESSITDPGDSTPPHEDAVSWDHPDGTTHWYLPVSARSGIGWETAKEEAAAAGGYLVTITSEQENTFVFGLVDYTGYWLERREGTQAGPWIGAMQPSASVEPDGNWQWLTGEAFAYENWTAGQPDESENGAENRIHFGEATSSRTPTWDDLNEGQLLLGYVIEWSDSTTARTVGLFLNDEERTYKGYTLFAPLQYTTTYLIDNDGRLVHSWDSDYQPANSVYLLENGNLLRTATANPSGTPPFTGGGAGGRVEEVAWDGTVVWAFEYQSELYLLHHDVEMLPNGNILMIAWEYKTPAEAILAGRDPDLVGPQGLWPDHVIEVEPTGSFGGNIVWEWHVWDHLIQEYDPAMANYGLVADHPERIDLNFDPGGNGAADWNHTNGIAYNEELDQIILSVRMFSEFWVIDHSTTSTEAAGHSGGNSGKGGDLLYRWGNPQAYQAGGAEDERLFVQHDAHWIGSGLSGEGNILVFNNGEGRPGGSYSSVDEIIPPVDGSGMYAYTSGEAFGPSGPVWSYVADPPEDFYSSYISGAQRLPNGNTLICEGAHGTLFEVTSDGEVVWRYVNPVVEGGPMIQGETIPDLHNGNTNAVFRAYRYGSDYPGLAGRDLTPGGTVEVYPSMRRVGPARRP